MPEILKGAQAQVSGDAVTVVQNGVAVPRNDAVSDAFYLEEQLKVLLPERFRAMRPKNNVIDHVPIDGSVPYGAKEVAYLASKAQGKAKRLASGATDTNRITISGGETKRPYVRYAVTVIFDEEDVATAALARQSGRNAGDLFADYWAAAYEALEEAINEMAWFGDGDADMWGLLTSDKVPEIDVTATPITAATTADGALDILKKAFVKVSTQSAGLYKVERLLLPNSTHELLVDKPRSTNSDKTVLQFLMETRGKKPGSEMGLTGIYGLDELDRVAQTGGRGRCALALTKDPMMYRMAASPMRMGQMEVLNGGTSFAVTFMIKISDLILPRPLSVVRLRGI
jgi:hypothetical protein